MADPLQDPAGAADDGAEAQGSYEICIKVDGQGGISVGVESEGAEAAAPAAGAAPAEAPDDDAGFQPAKNIREALSIAMDIYKNSGKVIEAGSGDDQMSAGFSGKPMAAAGGM